MKSKLFLTFGFFFIFLTVLQLWQRFTPVSVSVASNLAASDPSVLEIPSLHIKLPIVKATLLENHWQYTSTGVSYLTSTAIPGMPGNSVIYGHNWPNLLGRLSQIKTGAVILIYFQNGSQKKFTVSESSIVPASQTDILNSTADSRLTIFTCAGFLDSKRFVVVAR
jgi:LPXTG-site transpeptidase (sortase) family protein